MIFPINQGGMFFLGFYVLAILLACVSRRRKIQILFAFLFLTGFSIIGLFSGVELPFYLSILFLRNIEVIVPLILLSILISLFVEMPLNSLFKKLVFIFPLIITLSLLIAKTGTCSFGYDFMCKAESAVAKNDISECREVKTQLSFTMSNFTLNPKYCQDYAAIKLNRRDCCEIPEYDSTYLSSHPFDLTGGCYKGTSPNIEHDKFIGSR